MNWKANLKQLGNEATIYFKCTGISIVCCSECAEPSEDRKPEIESMIWEGSEIEKGHPARKAAQRRLNGLFVRPLCAEHLGMLAEKRGIELTPI